MYTWTRQTSAGAAPAGRSGHSLSDVMGRLVVVGGECDEGCVGDASVWSPTSGWTGLSCGVAPRQGHSGVAFDGAVLIFGGSDMVDVHGAVETLDVGPFASRPQN
jgi:hypothetical protein